LVGVSIYPQSHGIARRQTVFIGLGLKYGDVVARGLFDERDKITQRLDPQMMLAAERVRRFPALLLWCHALPAVTEKRGIA
jgi:hypothetical protein